MAMHEREPEGIEALRQAGLTGYPHSTSQRVCYLPREIVINTGIDHCVG